MKTVLRKGQILESGFEILEIKELEELEASGIWARHQKSGAQVFHIYNDDNENLFGFAFATAPEDSTGAPHILEHSVLCGSENYPLKDAFLVLAQGSLQTFLNAWTFPDKTLYPASSVNEHDYFNLMGVYGDAVFRPLISEWTFMQEGHRLEYEGDRLSITGVVYNEMKGAYSSLDAYAGLWSVKAVLPETPYGFESGGDPERIPDLTWEGLKAFHRSRYSPANCRVFLAGNIATEKQLAFLNEKFFSSLPAGDAAPPISRAAPWKEPRSITVPCPAGAEQKSTVLLSWLCCDTTDTGEAIALSALTETLLGHDGSPLTRALIDSGLGEDLSPVTGLEGELREAVFCAGLRGVDGEENVKKTGELIGELILNELRRLEKEGIPKEEIEAALLSMEFSHKEIRRSGGPFSLVWMRRSLGSWLHGGTPWDSLLFDPLFSGLKKNLAADPRYFEKLIRKYLLDNPHRALVVIKPEKDFLENKEAALAETLARAEAGLTASDRERIREKAAALAKIQEEGDSPEALAAIPHLSRGDLSAAIEQIPREFLDAAGAPALAHELFTNGITYIHLAFPVDLLEPEDYLWLPFFSRTVVSMGLPGADYGEVSSLIARTAGGFSAGLQTGSMAPGAAGTAAFPSGIYRTGGRDWIIYHLKALDEKIAPSLDLALRLITEADFTDLRRVRDLAMEMKNDIDSGFAHSGHSYAAGRSAQGFTRSRLIDELWGGVEQVLFAHRLVETGANEISHRLVSIRDRLAAGGLIVNLTGGPEAIKTALGEAGRRFGAFGGPKPSRDLDRAAFSALAAAPYSGGAEVFASPSLQVGFAAAALPAVPYGSPAQAAELVLAHQLSTGALWETIRMKGGAYGAFAAPDSLEGSFSFSTYRDPNPLRSLDAFSSILKDMAGQADGGNLAEAETARLRDELDKAVIGCYARETRPRTPADKGLTDLFRFFYGITDSHRAARLKSLIAVSAGDIAGAVKRLAAQTGKPVFETGAFFHPVIIAGKSAAESAAAKLGVQPAELPV
jgi:Zn-dependent M16 (insulinase) family peptidase